MISYGQLYAAYDEVEDAKRREARAQAGARNPFQTFLLNRRKDTRADGFKRIELCRQALAALDRQGWQRSFHQRKFHENFIRACARIFFKTEPDGTFQRAHQTILDVNGWETLSQEILISTPRRFGKTISVSMFAAAMLFSAPRLELAIYSTCKRISQKLLQNVRKFLNLITTAMKRDPMRVIRSNMEEMVLQGPDGVHDVRVVCSYPSKIGTTKGTGGDLLLLDEAAYISPQFFFETIAPLLIMGNTTLIAVSTLTSEISFYTRLIRMRDKLTGLPMFTCECIELACAACKADGKAADCVHMLHLVPRWQSGDRHIKLKTIMQDVPHLIESELSGLAFDSLQQLFKKELLDVFFEQPPPNLIINEDIHLFIDPAAGGPFSDYAIVSVTRQKGLVTYSTYINQSLCGYIVQVTGIDILSGCKDPAKQFILVEEHIAKLRLLPGYADSRVIIYVERNLGFEAEHHKRALMHVPNSRFYLDEQHDRIGVLTTNEVKHAMARLVVLMLEEKRLHIRKPVVSRDPKEAVIRLRQQMEIYSYQFKTADTTFQKDQIAISGKVGGMKDDICIALQLACYFTQIERQRDAQLYKRAKMQ